ncbi:MAG: MATE family efflux transporter [Saccharofermentanales bacterium]
MKTFDHDKNTPAKERERTGIGRWIAQWKRTPDLGRDPLLPLLLRFSVPAIFSYFISELYNMVDTFYVGNEVGANAIGALGAIFPVQRLIIALSLLLAFATSNSLAYHQGAGQREEAEKTVSAGLILNLVIMLPLTVLVYVFRHDIMPVLGAKGDLFFPAVDYVSIIIWGSVFLTLTATMARVLLTLGHAGLSIVLTSLGALINIIGDHILVKNLRMGVHGAAYATLASQVLSFLICLIVYVRITRRRHVRFHPIFSAKRFARLFSLGLPSFIVESEDAVVMAVLNLLLFRLGGETGVNVMAMNTKVYMFLFVLILGFAYGMLTVVAYNHGAGLTERMLRSVKLCLFLSLATGIVSTVLFYLLAEPLLSLFVNDAGLVALCVPTFRRMIVGLPLLAFYYTVVMYFQAIGKAMASSVLSLLRQIAILLPMALIFVYLFRVDLKTLFFAYPLTDLIAALISVGLFRKHLKLREYRT